MEEVSLREHFDQQLAAVRELVEERWRSDDLARAERKEYLEKRLHDLNGEAGRLKTILETSVSSEKFADYVEANRTKVGVAEVTIRDRVDAAEEATRLRVDAAEKALREQFAVYVAQQATAFKVYVDEMQHWRSGINVRIAAWAGGCAVGLALIQLYLNYST